MMEHVDYGMQGIPSSSHGFIFPDLLILLQGRTMLLCPVPVGRTIRSFVVHSTPVELSLSLVAQTILLGYGMLVNLEPMIRTNLSMRWMSCLAMKMMLTMYSSVVVLWLLDFPLLTQLRRKTFPSSETPGLHMITLSLVLVMEVLSSGFLGHVNHMGKLGGGRGHIISRFLLHQCRPSLHEVAHDREPSRHLVVLT
uniref:Uncharacterized protein n=1 Tax=Opuntia streptacantha TaxID=393608 RepID=A0A7C9EHZ5_OPUST